MNIKKNPLIISVLVVLVFRGLFRVKGNKVVHGRVEKLIFLCCCKGSFTCQKWIVMIGDGTVITRVEVKFYDHYQSIQLDHFYTNKKVVYINKFLSRLIQKQLPCTMELHFKKSKMTIVRHWAGGFYLLLHHTLWKNRAKILSQKWKKNCLADLQKFLKMKKMLFCIQDEEYNLLIINFAHKKVLLVLITY